MYVYEYELMYKCPHKHTLLIYGMILPTSRVKQGYSRKGNVHGVFLFLIYVVIENGSQRRISGNET